jgi:hypothetical protein
MTPRVGDVIRDWTTNLLTRNGDWKYHLCCCDRNLQFLYVCSYQLSDDFPLTDTDCDGMPNEESYLSLSRPIHVSSFSRRSTWTCRVSDEYLAALLAHIRSSPKMTPKDKRKVVPGLASHLGVAP